MLMFFYQLLSDVCVMLMQVNCRVNRLKLVFNIQSTMTGIYQSEV